MGTPNGLAGFAIGTPSVTGFSPSSGIIGTQVTIAGSNFTGTTAVKFGGAAAQSVTIDSDQQITATSPPVAAVRSA